MAAVKTLNPKAEVARAQAALAVNISAARGLQDVLRTNLGPKGTMKMLVSGAGDIKLTKDGNVLLHEMQIQHPTASLIAKVATAQDDITGDGTTSNVLIIGELLKQADLYISEGLHPRIITEGFEAAKEKALQFLEQVKVSREMDRETLIDVARTSLRTKVQLNFADVLTEAVVDSILAIKKQDEPIDLFMVEIMEMKHKSETDTSLGMPGLVYEYTLGEEKFTFIEKCNNPRSVTLLVKGPNKHTLTQIKDAIRDGLRAVKNAIDDGCVVPGAGAVEVAMAEALIKYKPSIKGRAQLGVQAFADALLIIPKVLAQNSGFDLQETLVKIQAEHSESGQLVGVDLNTGEPMVAAEVGIWDNYCVKKQLLHHHSPC
ncbi:T-complex protein 1 subunit zeta [Tupaia chinensis]|uniref:T-complex protein 1 subunit zeta n=1 Tax=Tupaia chinensis TaxID=246437 RepID=L9KGA8_TUPCH|nr:T-complex protein 1 subunit zeta [Tupaia chinensis]